MNLGKPTAARDRRHVSGKTRAVVLAKVADLERERSEREAPPAPGEKIDTVGDWIGYWLLYVAGRRTQERTTHRYRLILERHVLPRIGPVRLGDLHEHHLDRLFSSMIGEGARPTTLREVRRVLSTVLNDALARELVVRNVTHRAAIPPVRTSEVAPLTVEEAQRIFAVAESEPNGAAWLVTLALGLRRAEVLGLQWDDVDLDAATLTVRRSLYWAPWTHGCGEPEVCCFEGHDRRCLPDCLGHAGRCPKRRGGPSFTAPKSTAGHRCLALPPSLARAMVAHRDRQPRPRHRRYGSGLVFGDKSGEPVRPDAQTAAWKKLLARADVRAVRLHDARHSAATYLLMQGVDARTAMALMGWAHVEMTERYQHVVTPLRIQAAAQLEDLLWGSTSGLAAALDG